MKLRTRIEGGQKENELASTLAELYRMVGTEEKIHSFAVKQNQHPGERDVS